MNEAADPYAPPFTLQAEGFPSQIDLVRKIVLGWEKLRLIYNGVLFVLGLVVIGILLSYATSIGIGIILAGSVMAAVGANLCFFAGPLAELYFCAIFRKGAVPMIRWILFGGGMLISVIIFVGACALMVGLS